MREEPTPAGAPRQAFFRVGREILELVQEPEDVVERAGGRDRPARFWGLAVLVDDLDHAVAAMAPHVGSVRAAVQPGRRIATVRRSAGLAVPLALMSRDERDAVRVVSEQLWTAVDEYIEQQLLGPDPVLEAAIDDSAAAGLPAIAVSPGAGRAAEPARPHPRRAADPRARHARRLQHDLLCRARCPPTARS